MGLEPTIPACKLEEGNRLKLGGFEKGLFKRRSLVPAVVRSAPLEPLVTGTVGHGDPSAADARLTRDPSAVDYKSWGSMSPTASAKRGLYPKYQGRSRSTKAADAVATDGNNLGRWA